MNEFLPPYEDLTKEQDKALRASGSLFVSGPPGSGKTVIALYRAQELAKKGKKATVLTYGSVLLSYIKDSLESIDVSIDAQTFHRWLKQY